MSQRPVLSRLFGVGILSALGVRLDAIPAGRAEWPLLTAGVTPQMVEESVAVTAANKVVPTFTTEILKPKKLVGVYEFSHEQAAQVPQIEEALRRDLADSVLAQMSHQIISGDEDTNPEEIDGFLTTIGAPPDPGAESGFSDYAGAAAQAVDGVHAANRREKSAALSGSRVIDIRRRFIRQGAASLALRH